MCFIMHKSLFVLLKMWYFINCLYFWTRHEDGTVRFWDASSTSLRLLYKLSTSSLFGIPEHVASVEEEEWPPFRKVRPPKQLFNQLFIMSTDCFNHQNLC